MVTKKSNQKNQAVISSSQICTEVQKSYWGLGWMPKICFFFQLLNLKKILFGGWKGSHVPGDKKAQNGQDHLWLYTMYPTPCCNGSRMTFVKKKTKGAYQLLTFCIHVLNRAINILQFHIKVKFWSKVIVYEITGMNFWDTL